MNDVGDADLGAWSRADYQEWARGQHYFGQRNFSAVLRLARRFLHGRVLDAGAGDGSMIRALTKHLPAVSVVGVDLMPGRATGVTAGDLGLLPLKSNSFDCVLCMDVLEHLPIGPCPAILREIGRVLAPGGRLCLTVPNDEDIGSALVYCPGCRKWFHPMGHTRRFDATQLEAELSKAGFEDIQIRTYGVDAYYNFGALGGLVSMLGRVVLPKMRWDDCLFAHGRYASG